MACSECMREYTDEPNALCQNKLHWQAWSELLAAQIVKAHWMLNRCGREHNGDIKEIARCVIVTLRDR